MRQLSPFHFSIATRLRNPHFKSLLEPQPNELILDIGCGSGYFVDFLSKLGCRVVGIDPDPQSIRIAKETYDDQFLISRAESLPFADNTFDKILCSEVLEHIRQDRAAIMELKRVAKPDATIVVTVPSPEGILGDRIKSYLHSGEDSDHNQTHVRNGYRRSELRELLERNGIEVHHERYTMVLFAELLMGMTKLAYAKVSKRQHLHSQSEVMEVGRSPLLKLYRFLFPPLLTLSRIEAYFLAPILKGHMLIVKGVARKP